MCGCILCTTFAGKRCSSTNQKWHAHLCKCITNYLIWELICKGDEIFHKFCWLWSNYTAHTWTVNFSHCILLGGEIGSSIQWDIMPHWSRRCSHLQHKYVWCAKLHIAKIIIKILAHFLLRCILDVFKSMKMWENGKLFSSFFTFKWNFHYIRLCGL